MSRSDLAKAAQWKRRLDNWKQSGLSASKWCHAHNLSYHLFKYWQKKLEEHAQKRAGFVEISSTMDSVHTSSITIGIGPFHIQLEPHFDETMLERLLGVLGRSV